VGKAFPWQPVLCPSAPLPQELAAPATPPILCAVENERSLPASGADRDRASVLTALRTRSGYLGGAAAKHICARTPNRPRPFRERVSSLNPPERRISPRRWRSCRRRAARGGVVDRPPVCRWVGRLSPLGASRRPTSRCAALPLRFSPSGAGRLPSRARQVVLAAHPRSAGGL